jgi:hypothetical protein
LLDKFNELRVITGDEHVMNIEKKKGMTWRGGEQTVGSWLLGLKLALVTTKEKRGACLRP